MVAATRGVPVLTEAVTLLAGANRLPFVPFGSNARREPWMRLAPPTALKHAGWLTAYHTACMVCHMKTTLNIDDTVMASLRREAARTGRTMSELVETALRQLLRRRSGTPDLASLPSFDSGGALVDVADRDALYRVMDEQ